MHYAQILLLASPWMIESAVAVALYPRLSALAATLSNSSIHWSSETTLSLPNTTAFFNATERWTIYDPPTYEAALSPGTEEDVVQAVEIPSLASAQPKISLLTISRSSWQSKARSLS
jgi:hypothetical protein